MGRYLLIMAVVFLGVAPIWAEAQESLSKQFRQQCQSWESEMKASGIKLKASFCSVCVSVFEKIARISPTSKKVVDEACTDACETMLTVIDLKAGQVQSFLMPCISSCKREAYKKIPRK